MMTQPEILLKTADLPWVPIIEGIDFKLLRASSETGTWSVIFKAKKGSFFPAHKHFGAGEYLMLKGRMEYRVGVAVEGDYGYEPIDSIHEMTTFTEDSELLFTNHGVVLFLNEDGTYGEALDYKYVADLAAQHLK
ncbi:2,4'-dihydroxyacetophenone dioxygenase family protein [Kordiimonas pumila]|uniref:2,4'-dihydroxyacetophenone dioxygenase family protein n=1 Tax=Kordiimonas pumila TaxID=2161677 RepID=A0ABV7D8R7_9PROT|nr:2,4'-dihydroxyacetophenone dioxygenase family protein [Kordiimonas pumila]